MIPNLHYYWFLFRWFLIGRYHCESIRKLPCGRFMFEVIHKVLWFFLLFTSTLGSHFLLGYLTGF